MKDCPRHSDALWPSQVFARIGWPSWPSQWLVTLPAVTLHRPHGLHGDQARRLICYLLLPCRPRVDACISIPLLYPPLPLFIISIQTLQPIILRTEFLIINFSLRHSFISCELLSIACMIHLTLSSPFHYSRTTHRTCVHH